MMTTNNQNSDTPSDANLDKQRNLTAMENIEQELGDAAPVGELTENETGGKTNGHQYDLSAEGVTYQVKIAPFEFNGETRYYINVDDGPSHLFLWDEVIGKLKALDDKSAILPSSLIQVISEKLLLTK
jgi:hypothetical protein